MRHARALALLTATPALADEFDGFRGLYGSATDPAASCAANPHRLDFAGQRIHAVLDWQIPWINPQGREVTSRRFDVWGQKDGVLTLEEDGPAERLADGSLPTWHLRLTDSPKGYCWGRADWPVVRCEDQQVLCSAATS